MKIRWRYQGDRNWTNGELNDIQKISLCHLNVIEIRMPCEHEKLYIECGLRICKKCGDIIEITSYR